VQHLERSHLRIRADSSNASFNPTVASRIGCDTDRPFHWVNGHVRAERTAEHHGMKRIEGNLAAAWTRFGPEVLPFADAASDQLPLGRLLRLSLFQVTRPEWPLSS
jgi:hypothetical protein